MRPRTLVLLSAAAVALAAVVVAVREPVEPVAAAPAKPGYECRWTDEVIKLDGVADEAAWKNAQVIDGFQKLWQPKEKQALKTATRGRLLWDKEFLYFFADMDDADLFADVTEHDGATWNNDVFELFFKPAADKPGYFEFEVNAANAVFDAFFPKRDEAKNGDFIKKGDFHVETKVKLRGTLNKPGDKDQGWSVEGRIPWADFLRAGGRPVPGEQWAFTLCRYDYDDAGKNPDLSMTAPVEKRKIGSFFHQYEDYEPLTFVGPDLGPVGLKERVPVTTSTVVGSPDPPLPYRTKQVYPDFRPRFLIQVKPIPGTDQMLVITQPAPYAHTRISRVRDYPELKTAEMVTVFDTPDEGTATDLTFHPKFAENGYFYVGWSGKDEKAGPKEKRAHITRYTMDRTTFAVDPKSAVDVLNWRSNGHNGLAVAFGTDGMLYTTSGDGTSDSDTEVTGQSTDTLLAKVLRLDVDHPADGQQYAVPKDNPFVTDKRFRPETFAYGFRNPWRIAVDPKSGRVWVGNNGQDLWEQVYLVKPGENFGWSVMEGGHPFYPERKPGPTPISKPIADHPHSEFRSLTGGFVYHGTELPDLAGAYLYGDHSTGRIWAINHDGTKVVWHTELARSPMHITAFGTNTKGQLVICDHGPEGEGGLVTLVPTPKDLPPSKFPRKLSESGLFADVKTHAMVPGVVPYSVNAPFWSDGLHKERWLMVPGNETVQYTSGRSWNFPDNTVIVKSFAVEGKEGDPTTRKWVETRFMTKQEGEWIGYTYLWNDAGTDADLVSSAGLDKTFAVQVPKSAEHPDGVRKQVWHYPSRAECMTCHSRAANFVLGLSEAQMNRDHDYGGVTANQIRTLEHIGLFGFDGAKEAKAKVTAWATKKKLTGKEADEYVAEHGPQPGQREPRTWTRFPKNQAAFKKLPDPFDPKEDLTARAKAWLAVNCASCHVEAGGGNAKMSLGFDTALEKMVVVDETPVHSTLGIPDAKIIAPGHPEASVMVKRVGTRGPGQMPPLGSNRVDPRAVELLTEWAKSLKK